jgi:hypothetical protein
MPHDRPPRPWHAFFLDIDKALGQSVELHCIGGFAIAMLYGLPRPTVDIDVLSVVPVEEIARLQSLAGSWVGPAPQTRRVPAARGHRNRSRRL